MQTAATKAALTAMLAVNPFLFFANPPLWILGLTAPEYRGLRRLPVRPAVQPEAAAAHEAATVPPLARCLPPVPVEALQARGVNTPPDSAQRSHGTRKRTTVKRSSSGTSARSNSRRGSSSSIAPAAVAAQNQFDSSLALAGPDLAVADSR